MLKTVFIILAILCTILVCIAMGIFKNIEILTYVTYNNKEYILKRVVREYNCIYGIDIHTNTELTICGNYTYTTIIKEI